MRTAVILLAWNLWRDQLHPRMAAGQRGDPGGALGWAAVMRYVWRAVFGVAFVLTFANGVVDAVLHDAWAAMGGIIAIMLVAMVAIWEAGS